MLILESNNKIIDQLISKKKIKKFTKRELISIKIKKIKFLKCS